MAVLRMKRAGLVVSLARRELRGAFKGFNVFLTCLALGVAAVAAVGQLNAFVKDSLRADAKSIQGGDLSIRRMHLPLDPPDLDWLRSLGAVSEYTGMRSMARATARPAEAPALVEIKAVDARYPLFGRVLLDSGRSLEKALAVRGGLPGLIGDTQLLARLQVRVGDVVRIGKQEFRINDVLRREPDRASAGFSFGPRVLMTQDALKSTGLLQPGSIVRHVYKLRLGGPKANAPLAGVQRIKAALKERLDAMGVQVRDYTEAGSRIKEFLDDLAMYLTLVGLLSLLVGGVGVANGVQGYLESKTGAIATLKSLGATRRTIMSVYLSQTLFLAALGCLAGCLLGLGVSFALGDMLLARLGLASAAAGKAGVWGAVSWQSLAVATAYGLLTTLVFTLRPLSSACAVSPARLFRGYADPLPRPRSWKIHLLTGLVAAGILAVALLTNERTHVVLGFAAGVAAGILLFALLSWIIIRAASRLPHPRNPRLRQAVANLHRPGARTQGVVYSLGLGLTALAAVVLIDGNMREMLGRNLPETAPAFFFLDVPAKRIEAFKKTVTSTPGVVRLEYVPSIRGRIVRINGVPADQAEVAPDAQWALRSERGITYADAMPGKVKLVAGRWWPADYKGEPRICLAQRLAEGFDVGVGDSLTINLLGRQVTARIACIRHVDWRTLALNHAIIFAPGVVERTPHSYIATAYIKHGAHSGADQPLARRIAARFPNVAAIHVQDVLAEVTRITDNIGLAVQAAAVLTLLIGLLVLSETLRVNMKSRYYDAVLFKVLGATRADVISSLTFEFLILGFVTALFSAALGCAAAYVFITEATMGQWRVLPLPLLAVCLAGTLCTLATGLLGVGKVLGLKAWPVLRNE